MKITLDIPDTTVAAFFDFVYYSENVMKMQGHSMGSNDLYDGAEIEIKELEKEAQDA